MKTPQEITSELKNFYGSTTLYKHWLGLRYTQGIQYLAQEANCYWLLNAIASHQTNQFLSNPKFVELVICFADNEKFTIEFHPNQIPILEKLLNNLRNVTEQQINQQIETLQWELSEIKSCNCQIRTSEFLQNGNGLK